MTKQFDPAKPVQTRDGRKARIIATDIKSAYPIIAAYASDSGAELVGGFTVDGRYIHSRHEHSHDLVNVPERTERFFVVYMNLFPVLNTVNDGGPAVVEVAEGDCRLGQDDNLVFGVKVTFEDGRIVAVGRTPAA
ncbi:hypothetical protein [Sphingomonas sp.]|uniref:hypothetical protein n=1 Tax=Sphingomonas sp. TaxID=28214 RepID=UPI002EDB053C